jgi:DNA polymerase I
MKKEKLVIIDGHALIHRAYHAIPPLTTSSGELVNAVYGFSAILLNVLKDLKPACIVVAFDLPGKTIRHKQYSLYKAHRPKAPDELISQFKRVQEVVEAFNIPIYTAPGYEADDVIGSIAKSQPTNIETIIVTGDLDELQLVDPKTKVYTMKRGFTDIVIYDEAAVYDKYGLTPKEFIDYKALKGDPSDNIPGVAGIGDKGAINLLKEFGSLENIYANIHLIKETLAKKLEVGKESAFLSKKLATIKTDLELGFDLSKCYVHDYNRSKVFALFQELGFKSLLSKLPESEIKEDQKELSPLKTNRYQLVVQDSELDALLKIIEGESLISIKLQTDSTDPILATLVGISIGVSEGESYYIPTESEQKQTLVLSRLKPILENKSIKKIGHNLKFDYIVLKRHGIEANPLAFDTMIGAYLLNPSLKVQEISEVAFTHLGFQLTRREDIVGTGKNQLKLSDIPTQTFKDYACGESDVALRLYKKLEAELERAGMTNLMKNIEGPLIPVLARMELSGIKLDSEKLKEVSAEFEERLNALSTSIKNRAGCDFNIASPSQLQKILFENLKLDEKVESKKDLKKLKTGGYSTAASELEKLRGLDPIINDVFEFRELTKLKNTYIDVLPRLTDSNNRLHTSFNQAITQTGRLSSSEPNLQNIPIRSHEGKRIREAFLANSGNLLLSADYSQIELRVIAHLSQDPTMIKIFKEGRDIHAETAAAVFGVSESNVTPKMRRVAKIINFGIIYGVSAHGLKQQTQITWEESKNLIDRYFKIHPAIKDYTEKMTAQAHEVGYVETLFGRRRYLPEIKSSNFMVRSGAERMAINMPVQGTAADLIKLAMIEIDKNLTATCKDAKLLLQVHDELILEVPKKDIQNVAAFVKEKMDGVAKLSVPIETVVHWGENWEEAKE